ncbi:MAG TPA: thiamine-phosphate kinase [Intrasporangium sp.]|uniref:thiamine-phosphate kinase n=1 Tax=Intrasporangium sp. TaxID=1925024 RepID=UPI002D787881|nr:thiamine-phosphate kinase [Intrasporangium sp.]HET7399242.1 thiamine-phosphate kinase [Intrasporangium sp.]
MQLRPGPPLTGGVPLWELDEEEILARVLPLLPGSAGLVVPPGDDAAVVRTADRTIATTDTVVLGRDWLDEWSSGADVGHKVVTQNLADVAAMGGRPTGVLLTLVADPAIGLDWVLDHARGVAQACRAADVGVLGGDLSSAPAGVVMVSVTALGRLAGEPVLRSGAHPGDVVAVRGSLGLAAAGLRLLQAGTPELHPEAVARQRRPHAPLAAGPEAAEAGASAMLDISDGLLRDGGRLARASGVVLDLDPTAIAADVDALVPALGPSAARACVLGGGEEHSLLATFPGRMPGGWRRIGVVRAAGAGQTPGVLLGGRPQQSSGWDHFRPAPGGG